MYKVTTLVISVLINNKNMAASLYIIIIPQKVKYYIYHIKTEVMEKIGEGFMTPLPQTSSVSGADNHQTCFFY